MTGEARYLEANRDQLRWDIVDLNNLPVSDHRARIVLAFVTGLDLSELQAGIRAREGEPERLVAGPEDFVGLVVVRDTGRGGFDPPTRPAVPAGRCLSLAVWRRASELSRTERLPVC
jgi:hypothetical protein